ncbi:carboxymuconolactone decarboxylase family protein [Paenibacillus rigui]|uniref:Alkylhydroperoxidase n=1 Tax=Paenibacillus rigui TaxID=554312 RepID=A0A229UND6_9BACL|nr:carboxymuconolactone decarboxylase family protein [Paenibacillus rigui]OXM84805.1 alkylhydroperoxidase [Paenibacillus rigui]
MNSYYDRTHLEQIPELIRLAPEAAASFLQFEEQLYHGSTSKLPMRTKELIAVTVAHVTGCPYCIDVHVRKYKEQGGTMEEIVEALLVAAATRSGAILSHGVQALLAYNRQAPAPEAGTHRDQQGSGSSGTPECFC